MISTRLGSALHPYKLEFPIPRADSPQYWGTLGITKEDPRWPGRLFELLVVGPSQDEKRWKDLLKLMLRRALWLEWNREHKPSGVVSLDALPPQPSSRYESADRDPKDIIRELGLPPAQQLSVELKWEAVEAHRPLEQLASRITSYGSRLTAFIKAENPSQGI